MPELSICCLLVAAFAGCGGLDPQTSLSQQPPWRPAAYFSGLKIGYRTVFDRNGNVREVARIERKCEARPADQAGVCEDQIDYSYGTADTADITRWSIHYITDLKSEVAYQDGFGRLSGETVGAMMILRGERQVPGTAPVPLDSASAGNGDGNAKTAAARAETATAEVRLHLRPGPGRPMLQTELYTYLGFDIGRSDTLWLDR
ncbi:MAG: hypothetical protein NXI24_12810 [bacterium]|nr:hypothetical protein [bacterium]